MALYHLKMVKFRINLKCFIFFLILPAKDKALEHLFPGELNSQFTLKIYWQNKKSGLGNKVVDPTSLLRNLIRHWGTPLKNLFKMIYIFWNCLKASRETRSCNTPPTDGARACRLIGLDRKPLGVVREEGQLFYHGNIKDMVVTFGKKRMCLRMVLQLSYM